MLCSNNQTAIFLFLNRVPKPTFKQLQEALNMDKEILQNNLQFLCCKIKILERSTKSEDDAFEDDEMISVNYIWENKNSKININLK